MGRWFWVAMLVLLAVAGYEVHEKGPREAFGGSLAFLFPDDPALRARDSGVIEDTEEYRWERGRLVRRWRR